MAHAGQAATWRRGVQVEALSVIGQHQGDLDALPLRRLLAGVQADVLGMPVFDGVGHGLAQQGLQVLGDLWLGCGWKAHINVPMQLYAAVAQAVLHALAQFGQGVVDVGGATCGGVADVAQFVRQVLQQQHGVGGGQAALPGLQQCAGEVAAQAVVQVLHDAVVLGAEMALHFLALQLGMLGGQALLLLGQAVFQLGLVLLGCRQGCQ